MKKYQTGSLLIAAAALFLQISCTGGQQSKDYMEMSDSVTTILPDTAFYGHIGESTGMSVLEFITENGDTLILNKTDEETGNPGQILGDIRNYTDQYAIIRNNNLQSIRIALNITQLIQEWQSSTDPLHGFQLHADGKAKALSSAQFKYNQWSLYNCRLVLLKEFEGEHGSETQSDTMDILELSADTLVLQNSKTNSIEKFYHNK